MAEKLKTPKFRVCFPNLFEAKSFNNSKPTFSVVMLFDPNADLAALKAECKKVAQEKFGSRLDDPNWKARFKSPFRAGSEKEAKYPEFAGKIWVTARTYNRPGVVNEANEIIDSSEANQIYAGCYAHATVKPYAYDNVGNYGVAIGLINLQKLKDGEALTSFTPPQDDFEPVAQPAGAAEDVQQTSVDDLL